MSRDDHPMDAARSDRARELALVDETFDRLFPICRSITGPGLRESLEILGEHLPLSVESVASGTEVFDWKIPPEWRLREAWVEDPTGARLADFRQSNLHVVNYSAPVDRELPLEELRPHLHSIPELPDAVPYVTSYYQRNWGFCLPHRTVERLPEGTYRAHVDSEFVPGTLDIGQAVLAGESEREVLVSSYLCHPSLANNELSGPLVLMLLYRRIARWPRRRFSYRFLLNPETIGSIVFLWKHGDELRQTLRAGIVLTCLGGPSGSLSYKTTRRETADLDLLVDHLNAFDGAGIRKRPFTPVSGSDERQFCSPGFDLPVAQLARTVYGEYDGYHNSLDTKEFMGIERLVESADAIERLLLAFEQAGRFLNQNPHGEPQLGRRDLYPNVNRRETWSRSSDTMLDEREFLNAALTVLNYSDGRHSMIDIANRLEQPIHRLGPVIERLEEAGLLAGGTS